MPFTLALAEHLTAEVDRSGDPDLEPNDDEIDGTGAEDEIPPRGFHDEGSGCSIADPDFTVDNTGLGGGDRTYAECHTLPAAARHAGRIEGI